MQSTSAASLLVLAAAGLGMAVDTFQVAEDPALDLKFPEHFLFSTSTASYQIEGGWNASGKGESIWDRMTHEHPEKILDGSNGDIACDSYHKYKEDIQLVKSLGASMYRFSLSWPRLLPTGGLDVINQDGMRYYHAVIEECIANDIEPMVTLFHWDLPQPLQDLGGFSNEVIADYFEDYADLVFREFGGKVKWWLTMNEPYNFCQEGYGVGTKAPMVLAEGRANYLCGHTMLKAHARAYRLYEREYKRKQRGKVSISVNTYNFWPKNPKNQDDVAASDRWQQFILGWFANPIFSKEGDYPDIMKKSISDASKRQGLKRSRLPSFTMEEVKMIKGSADFMGFNTYSSRLVSNEPATSSDKPRSTKLLDDAQVSLTTDPAWEKTIAPWHFVVPEGIRTVLQWIKDHYDNPDVFITENGYPDDGLLDDVGRVNYYRSYLREILKAIHYDRCKVIGYTAWSLMDNFEWLFGYRDRFGLFHVNFTDPARSRTPKKSAAFYQLLVATRKLPKDSDIVFPITTLSPTGSSTGTPTERVTAIYTESPTGSSTETPTGGGSSERATESSTSSPTERWTGKPVTTSHHSNAGSSVTGLISTFLVALFTGALSA